MAEQNDELRRCEAFLLSAPRPLNLSQTVSEVSAFISLQAARQRRVALVTVSDRDDESY